MIDHVIVGHRIAVGRDEEAGAFAGNGVMSARRMRPELRAELLTELVAELPEEFVEWRAGLNRDLLLPIIALIAVVLQHRWFGRTGYFDPYGDHLTLATM